MITTRPPSRALPFLLAGVASLLSGAVLFGVWHHELQPIQSVYLATYFKAQYMPTASAFGITPKPKRYMVLTVNGKDASFANMPNTMTGVGVRYTWTSPNQFAQWLQRAVYENESGLELVATPAVSWGVLTFLFLIAASVFAAQQKRKALSGARVRGPENMAHREFNRSQGFFYKKGFALNIEPGSGQNDKT